MQSDLSEAERVRRSRFIIRSLYFFWPIVDSSDDIDRVTRIAYSICMWDLLINALAVVPDLLRPDWMAWTILALLCLITFLGANAVRQKSVAAAALLCLVAATHIPVAYVLGHTIPYLACGVFLAYLIAWRGVALAARFQASPSDPSPLYESDILPLSYRTSFGRYMTDRLPPKVWPAWQWLFWITAVLFAAAQLVFVYAYTHVHLQPN